MMSNASKKDELPRTKFFLRGKHSIEGIHGFSSVSGTTGTIDIDDAFKTVPPADLMEFSSNGDKMVLVNSQIGMTILDTTNGNTLLTIENPGIQAITWSPMGTFLLSWQRPQKDSQEGNLIVWNSNTGELVTRFYQKSYSKDKWPSLQWSADEIICARQTNNGVIIYNGKSLENPTNLGQINLQNTTAFSLAPGIAPYKIALFVPEKKGKPARVNVYQFPGDLIQYKASKSFYKAQDVHMRWSPNGSALIIETHTDVDSSGQSYYGETGLFYLQADGEYDCIVPLTKPGPVHDVAWDPTGRGFIVIAGTMPANATLYDLQALPIFEFGAAPRNHISWSPHGRFLCLAGFGNLRGDMDFWDRNKLKKLGTAHSSAATTHSWSPDSRYFITATTFPRLRVDNGFKVFRYYGGAPIHEESRVEIYDLKFCPAPPNTYPNRPASPRRSSEPSSDSRESSLSSAFSTPKPQAYRPPNSTGALAAMMRQEKAGASVAKKVDRTKYAPPAARSESGSAVRKIPGMSAPVVSSATKKNSKAVKKKKAMEAAAARAELEKTLGLVNIVDDEEKKTSEASEEKPPPPASPVVLTDAEKQKKVKNLMKKMKQIEELKKRRDTGDKLNEDQLSKIESEQSIQSEIDDLSK